MPDQHTPDRGIDRGYFDRPAAIPVQRPPSDSATLASALASALAADADYYTGDYLQDHMEFRLLELCGEPLVELACSAATAYVDHHHPWDGQGIEPAERVSAFCAFLWRIAEHVDRAEA